jgi:type II restriction/modification system DNA methylase subunit YeeA
MPTLSVPEFVARWQRVDTNEKQSAQPHFIDLCAMLGQPTPAQADPTGTRYTFERGVAKTGGGQGFADVWLRDHFAWEYKGKNKSLDAAFQQLLQYREDLENPPLLIVCDLNRFEVHTNFTNTAKKVYAFTLADLTRPEPVAGTTLTALAVLRACFDDPARLRPDRTTAQVTEQAAAEFARLAESLRKRGEDPEQAAHFLMRLLFCLFAEDIKLLPDHLFTRLIENSRTRPARFNQGIRDLFRAMSAPEGTFGEHDIRYFNGGLFADDHALLLAEPDLTVLARAATLDWASIEPAIFGTLFERSLDPAKRSQLGAHYTSREDILLIVEPVLMAPLRRRWAAVQEQAAAIIARRDAATRPQDRAAHLTALRRLLQDFDEEIARVRVLDPACGSGNFLYVALKRLLDLEKEVSNFAATNGLPALYPRVDPAQLYGIEVNSYAYELASVVVWIGYIQWLRDNGYGVPESPVLRRLDNIRHQDAILAYDAAGHPIEPPWPDAEVIIGNPPFVGGNKIRQQIGDDYVNDLFKLYAGRVPAFADYVCYWFEKAREQIAKGQTQRVGLLATNSIRGGVNRRVLERIKETGDIFWAQSDRDWILDGANVHVSMIGFDAGREAEHELDNQPVTSINSDLTSSLDLTQAARLKENLKICFIGTKKAGAFDIDSAFAHTLLSALLNPNGRPNSDVVLPWLNGEAIVRRPEARWIIYFGEMTEKESALYEEPFEYVRRNIYPERQKNNEERARVKWWQHRRPAAEMWEAVAKLSRYIATPRISKYRIFIWVPSTTLPDDGTYIFARDDDYFFGVIHSKLHELWALRMGTSLEDRPRYTPTTTFETFPFPWPPGQEPPGDARVEAIAAAARRLVQLRDTWLNPPGATEADLKPRTLTNLYNARPEWLAQAHRALDAAVLAAYGWPADLPDAEILARLLALNHERAGRQ